MTPALAELMRECLNYLRAGGWLMLPLGLIGFWIWLQYLLLLCRLREALQHDDPHALAHDTQHLHQVDRLMFQIFGTPFALNLAQA